MLYLIIFSIAKLWYTEVSFCYWLLEWRCSRKIKFHFNSISERRKVFKKANPGSIFCCSALHSVLTVPCLCLKQHWSRLGNWCFLSSALRRVEKLLFYKDISSAISFCRCVKIIVSINDLAFFMLRQLLYSEIKPYSGDCKLTIQ